MLTIERTSDIKGRPAIQVRFVYLEPTHEIMEALEKAEVDFQPAVRSMHGRAEISDAVAEGLPQDHYEEYLIDQVDAMINGLGNVIVTEQAQRYEQTLLPPEEEE